MVIVFDLENYVNKYQGHTKLERLLRIMECSPELAPEASRILLKEVKQGINTKIYTELIAKMPQLEPCDTEWVEKNNKYAMETKKRLDNELSSYKTNLIKESIRMGHNDLGKFHLQRGDLPTALKCYIRTRDFCTTQQHIVQMCLNVIKVSILMGNYMHVANYVGKAEQSTPAGESLDPTTSSMLTSSFALSLMHDEKYSQAAKQFLRCNVDIGASYNEVMHAEDIAIYGGICALATFSREELKSSVIDNQGFKAFLELVPRIRELITDFYSSNYKSCLKFLRDLKQELDIDIHLREHVNFLFDEIRNRALIQYFSPFLSVDLTKMAAEFDVDVSALEKELSQLIVTGRIAGRIDSKNKVLFARSTDQRVSTYRKAIALGQAYVADTKAVIVRMQLIKIGITA